MTATSGVSIASGVLSVATRNTTEIRLLQNWTQLLHTLPWGHDGWKSPIDAGAQPISTEIPADLTAAVDNLVRDLWNRQHWSTNTAIVIVPRNQRMTMRNLLCSAVLDTPMGRSMA